MKNMKMTQFPHMPQSIEIIVQKNLKTGVYVIELPEYDVVTEADTDQDVPRMIDDLIFELFEVPEEYQAGVSYGRTILRNAYESSKRETLPLFATSYFHNKFLC